MEQELLLTGTLVCLWVARLIISISMADYSRRVQPESATFYFLQKDGVLNVKYRTRTY